MPCMHPLPHETSADGSRVVPGRAGSFCFGSSADDCEKGLRFSMDAFQAKRWRDFRRRAEYAPEDLYRHRTRGWEYIPVHPFGDESEVLARLGLRPEDCRTADAWWGIEGDATLLESGVVGALPQPAGLFAKA